MKNSAIQWTDHTFNPWIGCTKVSPGCANCYAEVSTPARARKILWGKGQPRQRTKTWRDPIQWNKLTDVCPIHGAHPRYSSNGTCGVTIDFKPGSGHVWCQEITRRPRVFCASLADIFDPEVSAVWRHDLFWLITQCHHLDFLLLTKRPELVIDQIKEVSTGPSSVSPCWDLWEDWQKSNGLPNVWIGTTAENQDMADKRIPALLQIPAKIRFLSVEPMLGPNQSQFDARGSIEPARQNQRWHFVGNRRWRKRPERPHVQRRLDSLDQRSMHRSLCARLCEAARVEARIQWSPRNAPFPDAQKRR